MKLNQILNYAGFGIGAIALLTLVSRHPINISFVALGWVIWFAGNWFAKKGK